MSKKAKAPVIGVALLIAASAPAGIIGNTPLELLKARASAIFAGKVLNVTNTAGASTWVIQVDRVYSGSLQTVVAVEAGRPLSPGEIDQILARRAIFMADAKPSLLRRTGSILVSDFFVPAPKELADMSDSEDAFCADWIRGVGAPDGLIVRDLAIAANYCGADAARAGRVAAYLARQNNAVDRLAGILVRLPQGDPSALVDLKHWLEDASGSRQEIEHNIAWALSTSYMSPDASGTAILAALARTAKSPLIREAATVVLNNIHTDETWAELASLLDSPDPEVRRLAMSGLQQTVDAGARGVARGPFERPLVHRGRQVKRNVRRRPAYPESAKIPAGGPYKEDSAQLKFWRAYAAAN